MTEVSVTEVSVTAESRPLEGPTTLRRRTFHRWQGSRRQQRPLGREWPSPRPARSRPGSPWPRQRRSTGRSMPRDGRSKNGRRCRSFSVSPILFRVRQLLLEHRDELATLLVREHGKVWSDAQGELTRGFECRRLRLRHSRTCSRANSPSRSGRESTRGRCANHLGVVAAVTPFNFPAMLPLWTLPIAIACGNTFVLKPSEKDPSCGLRLAELFHEAGVPDGVRQRHQRRSRGRRTAPRAP